MPRFFILSHIPSFLALILCLRTLGLSRNLGSLGSGCSPGSLALLAFGRSLEFLALLFYRGTLSLMCDPDTLALILSAN